MGAAPALCGLKASVLCGEWGIGRRLSMVRSKDDALSLFAISKLICTNPPSLATEQCLPLLYSDTNSNSSLAGDWSFLITKLVTILGTYLAIRSLPISIESGRSSFFQGDGSIEESSRDSQLGGVNSYGPPLRIHGGVR
ncbi:hypothetical protein CDAR_446591 [Caerostris darwini]|uniref:Uncharacterized protein n=1 Tax=Caerostris darwini TaxID=1538125 RepID=A0AAV4PMT3_9ARAC|nr:hypothetical protein CDAR_446591 [Caerostris darwini]